MARDPKKTYKMEMLVDTRLSGVSHKAGDDVELSGLEADRLEANRIVKAKPQPKQRKKPEPKEK